MLTKVCTKCSVDKTVDCFSPQSAGKFGVRSVCKSCAAVVAMKHYEDNKESQLAKKKIYRRDHKDAIRSQVKQYQQINKEKLTTQKKHYQQTNPHIYAANNARRRSLKIQATRSVDYIAKQTCNCCPQATTNQKVIATGLTCGRLNSPQPNQRNLDENRN
jgi:di/tripeptidase